MPRPWRPAPLATSRRDGRGLPGDASHRDKWTQAQGQEARTRTGSATRPRSKIGVILQARARGGSDTGAVVAAELHPADEGDTTTLEKTRRRPRRISRLDAAPTAEDPAECVTDKGYHSRSVLKALDAAPGRRGSFCALARRRGGPPGSHQQPTRLLSGAEAFKLRAEISFAHNLDRGGMWLRGRENVRPAPCRRPQSESFAN